MAAKVGVNILYIFVVVRVYLLLQQRQQVIEASAEVLLLHLHEQTTNLSPETLQTGLRHCKHEKKIVQESYKISGNSNAVVDAHLLSRQPGVDEGVQGVPVVQLQLGQQGLDGDGGHFLAASGVIVDHNQGKRGEEESAVLR